MIKYTEDKKRNPECKHSILIPIFWPTCPGCIKEPRAGPYSGTHSSKYGECRETLKVTRGKAREGHVPREPRIPARWDESSGMPAGDASAKADELPAVAAVPAAGPAAEGEAEAARVEKSDSERSTAASSGDVRRRGPDLEPRERRTWKAKDQDQK